MRNLSELGIARGRSQAALRRDLRGYGCEIEFEVEDGIDPTPIARRIVESMGNSWSVTSDGSLRNGLELYSPNNPCPTYREMRLNLEAYFRALDSEVSLKPSWRAALQFHVDIGDFTVRQLQSLVLFYAALEPYLFYLAGRGRDESNFCVPWYVAGTPYYDLVRSSVSDEIVRWLQECSKYSALNLSPILRQGTVEFRHLETPALAGGREAVLDFFDRCRGLVEQAIFMGTVNTHEVIEHGLATTGGLAHYLRSRVLGTGLAGSLLRRNFGKTSEVVRRSDDLVTQLAEAVLLTSVKDQEAAAEDTVRPAESEVDHTTGPYAPAYMRYVRENLRRATTFTLEEEG